MATLKDHQQAMVDLLASGSGIPASASRLAHAMHDLIDYMWAYERGPLTSQEIKLALRDATTPGLNDKALAGDIEACRPKVTPAERRIKELENTVKQLRGRVASLKADNNNLECQLNAVIALREPEQAGCRKDDTQVCKHDWAREYDLGQFTGVHRCVKCGATI